jgi:hypothetical protein
MATKSFIEILEEQIRTDLRREIEAEVRSEFEAKTQGSSANSKKGQAGPATENMIPTEWLLHRLGKTFFNASTTAQKTYQRAYQAKGVTQAAQPAPQAKEAAQTPARSTEPTRYTPTTLQEICALELIRRTSGVSIGDSYTEMELKTAWRKAARKTHPDLFAQADQITQMRMSVLFRELAEAFEHLLAAFEASAEKSQAAA